MRPSRCCIRHSRITSGCWRGATRSAATRASCIGTRSAVFAPVPELGLIVVDEEHDASFKQHEGGFRYSARDLAVRARAARAACRWCSARRRRRSRRCTTWQAGRYTRLPLPAPRRAGAAAAADAASICARTARAARASRRPAVQAIERHLAEDGQVLVFLNRRGYAPTLLCTACGWIAPCRELRCAAHRASAEPAGCAAITAAPTRRCRRAARSAASR